MADEQTQQQERRKISAEEFIAICKGEISEGSKYAHFYNVELEEDVIVPAVDNVKNIIIENSIFNDIQIFKAKKLLSIEIIGSKINLINIEKSTIRTLEIKDAHIDSINVDDSKLDNIWLIDSSHKEVWLDNALVETFWLSEGAEADHLWMMNNNEIENLWVFDDSKVGNIDIVSTTLTKLWIGESVLGNIIMSNCNVEEASIANNSVITSLKVEYLKEELRLFEVQSSIIHYVKLLLDKPSQIIVNSGRWRNNKRCVISHIDFSGSVFSHNSNLQVAEVDVNIFRFSSFVNHGAIVLSDIQANTLDWNYFSNFYQISKYNPSEYDSVLLDEFNEDKYKNLLEFIDAVNKPSLFGVENSDLGNTQIIGCNLKSFNRFEFKNSKILDAFIADSILPDKDNINVGIRDNEQKRLALSQFKKIYEKQGDAVRAIEFRANEMEVYRKQLKEQKQIIFSNEMWQNLAERSNLFINKYSNSFGSNWLRAAVTTLLINWVLFTAYCLNSGFKFDIEGIDIFLDLSSYSFGFLNPVHKSSFMDSLREDYSYSITPISRWIDYIGRIVMAYMVYQTVAAFRKFGKRSA